MIIYLDNIIFNRQQHGIESRAWANMIRGLLPQPDAQLRFIEYANAIGNDERFRLDLARRGHLYVLRNFWLTQWLAVNINGYDKPFIFHSSSCRVCSSPHAVNIITVTDSYKPTFFSHIAISRCDHIICTSRAAVRLLPRNFQSKATVVSTKKSNENIALSILRVYRRALAAKAHATR